MNKIHVALIGCGGFGNVHLNHLLKMEDVQIDALVNTGRENLEKTGQKVPCAKLYQDYLEMFEVQPQLDAVVVCVTPARHAQIEQIAAKKKLAIYLEKPIGIQISETAQTKEIIEQSGIICSVGYQERYNPHLKRIQQELAEESIGLITGRWIGDMPQAPWWRLKEQSGGQLLEQCTHIFDMLRFLFGEVSSVYAVSRNDMHQHIDNCNVDDCAAVTLQFQNGIIASIQTGCYQQEKAQSDIGFTIYAGNKTIDYHWGNSVEIICKHQKEVFTFDQNCHFQSLNTFIQAVKNQDTSMILSDYSDAFQTLKVTLAAEQSIKEQRPIFLK